VYSDIIRPVNLHDIFTLNFSTVISVGDIMFTTFYSDREKTGLNVNGGFTHKHT